MPNVSKKKFIDNYLRNIPQILSHQIVADTETLIRHYDKTLESWLERFLSKKSYAKDMFDEIFVKMWEFYLAS